MVRKHLVTWYREPWYPQVYCSEETATEENLQIFRVHRVQCLIHFSHNHPTSAKDLLPFNKSPMFTLSLKLSTFTFWVPFTFWEAFFHKIKDRLCKDLNATDNNMGLTENFSTSAEL
jgi:hypothetical protein